MADTLNQKTLNTRIKLKYDSYENWSTNNPVLLAGEVALVYVPADKVTEVGEHNLTGTTPPHVLMKVGDGTSNFNSLKYVSALAADVNSYAKMKSADFEAQVKALASAQVSESIKANADAIDALEALVGTESVTTQIANAITALNLADTYAAKEHTHTKSEITDFAHTHTAAEITDFAIEAAKKVDKVTGKSLVDDEEIAKLAGVSEGANKVEASTNGKIKIDGVDTTVYTHPDSHTASEISDFAVEVAKVKVSNASKADNATSANSAKKVENKLTVKVGGSDIVFDGSEAKTADVDAAIEAAINAIPEQTDYTVTCTDADFDATDSAPAFKRHTLTQNGQTVCTIDIPKELVVEAGSVKSVEEENDPYDGAKVGDKYIELVIANQEEPIYIPAKDLVDIYTAKNNAAEVQVAISNTNEISATLVNKGITEAKLDDGVTTKLNKVWEEVGVADGLVESLKSELEDKINAIDNHSHANKGVLDGITAEKVSAWDSAEKNAKDYADSLADNYAEAEHTHEIDDVTGLQSALNTKANDADLAAIAKSGTTDDLAQGTKVLIFDCGTSDI